MYKLLVKARTNRLKGIIHKCICDNQPTFVPQHSILDNAMIAIEVFHHIKIRNHNIDKNVALKLDISKIYDHIDLTVS